MTSHYIEQSAAAVEENRAYTRRKVQDALDRAWLAVNALGGMDNFSSTYDTAYNKAIDDALREIEQAGGMDPALRKADRQIEHANNVLEAAE